MSKLSSSSPQNPLLDDSHVGMRDLGQETTQRLPQDPLHKTLNEATTRRRSSIVSLDSLIDTDNDPHSAAFQGTRHSQNDGKPQPNKPFWHLGGTWTMEVLCFLIALGCFGAIVGIVYTHQGQTLSQWPFQITLNALIGVFTSIFKAALLAPMTEGISQIKWRWFSKPRELADVERFDNATRGVWGSLLLLCSRLPGLSTSWLPRLGAAIIVAALLIEPFSQQLIQNEPCMRNAVDLRAKIPKTQVYNKFKIHVGNGQDILDGTMQGAIFMGLLNPPKNSSQSITATCQTGNCTFPHEDGAAFSSLAMCSSCIDISDTIVINDTAGSLSKATIPSGALIQPNLPMSTLVTTNSSGPGDPMFSFDALMSRDGSPANSSALTCSLFPCYKTYGARVSRAVYDEVELSSANLVFTSQLSRFSLAANHTLRNGTWQACNPSQHNSLTNTIMVNTTTMSVPNTLNTSLTGGPILWYPDDCVWQLGAIATKAIPFFLRSFFHNNSLQSLIPVPDEAFGDLWLMSLYRNGTATVDTAESYMDGLAWSITAAMRQDSVDREALATVRGEVLTLETCVRVEWGWISILAALLGLGIVFLATVIFMTPSGADWRGDWKSSSLALLLHGLDETVMTKERNEMAWRRDDMLQLAKGIKVQLQRRDGRWRFREAEQS